MRYECYFCHIKTIEKLIQKFKPDAGQAEKFLYAFHELLHENWDKSNPYLAGDIHRIARKHLNHSNLYQKEKSHANELLLNQYSYWKKVVHESNNPFYTAAKLSVVGNIIDYGAHSTKSDLSVQIHDCFQKELKINQTKDLQDKVRNAGNILFLGDNAGEIVFDKLFIEIMNHPNVIYAVRGKPVINDVTIKDAEQVGMDSLCKIISNGFDAPSTLLAFSSNEFVSAFNDADLIISKGQGNFEGLMDGKHPNIFFMLMAKCVPMAELLHVNKGDMVVMEGN